jgi:hypothetical protein
MLSTKDMSAGSGKTKPVIDAGNQLLKINSIKLHTPPYDSNAYDLQINVESEAIKGDFDGFLHDVNNPNGPRYAGQVGRVSFQRYAFADATLPSGREISRDAEIMKSLIFMAEQQNKRSELDAIEANTIEEFVTSANNILSGDTYYNFCIAGREWENKEGYINLQFFLPKRNQSGVPFEDVNVENSKLTTFNRDEHIIPVKNRTAASTGNSNNTFEPSTSTVGGDDFDL